MSLIHLFLTCFLILFTSVEDALSAALEGLATSGSNGRTYSSLVPNKSNQSYQLCGTQLLEAVRTICRGNYAAPYRRSDPNMSQDTAFNEVRGELYTEPRGNSIDAYRGRASSRGNHMRDLGDWATDLDSQYAYSDVEAPTWAKFVLTKNKSHQRVRRSIIEECCRKSCRIEQIARYCSHSG